MLYALLFFIPTITIFHLLFLLFTIPYLFTIYYYPLLFTILYLLFNIFIIYYTTYHSYFLFSNSTYYPHLYPQSCGFLISVKSYSGVFELNIFPQRFSPDILD